MDRANGSNLLSLQYDGVPVRSGHRLTRYIIYPDGSLRHKQNSQTFSFLLWNLAVNPSAEGHALPLSYRGMQWFVYATIFYYINRLAKEQLVNSWLPRQESNLGKRIQSPSCYLYTTRQYSFLPVYRCRRSGSNRHESRLSTVFETVASANSATPA